MITARPFPHAWAFGCALLVLALSASVCQAARAPAAEDSVTLHGKAVTVSGSPVPGVKVTLADHTYGERPRTWTATSGAGGAFSVAVPADAAYRLSVTVEGPADGRLAPCALVGAPTLSMFQEEPTPMTVLFAPATSRVTGTVSGPAGEPVSGATVTLSLSQSGGQGLARWKAVTDKQGKYEITRLAAGDYVVGSVDPPTGTALIRLYSWKPGSVRRVSLGEGAAPVEDFRLPAGVRLQGRVLDEAGRPVAGAAVACTLDAATEEGPQNMYQMPGQWYRGEAVTDAQGRYSVGGLTKETYRLTVQPPQGANLAPAVLRGVNAPDSGDVELQGVTLYQEGRLLGVVVGPDGKPVAGAEVSTAAPGLPENEKPRAVTDAAGRFALAGLPTGKYAVTVRPPAGSTCCEHVFDGIAAISGFALEHPLKLPEGACVAGTVTDPGGKPVAGATVHLSLGYQSHVRTVADAGGRFKIVGVPPAMKQAGPRGQAPPITLSAVPPESAPTLLGASTPLKDLASGKTTQADLRLGAGGAMAGLVKGPDGKPVAGCQVIAFQRIGAGGYSATSGGRTGRDGRFTVAHVPPGNWALSVIPPAAAGLMLQAVPERAVAAGKTDVADVTLRSGGGMVGRVVTTKGKPVAGAHVRLEIGRDGGLPYMPGMDNQNRYVALTDRDGAFRFEGLLPGTHKIRCDPIDPGLLVEAADVKISPPGPQKVEMVAHITGVLCGTVRGADGKPLGYEFLSLRLQSPAAGAKGAYQPYPDAEGRFRLAGVIPGKYTLTVVLNKRGEEKNLAAPAPLEVVIREAQETAVDVKVGSK